MPADRDARSGPRLSFTIPYYSNPDYLMEAVASVRAQSIDDWDLTIVAPHPRT